MVPFRGPTTAMSQCGGPSAVERGDVMKVVVRSLSNKKVKDLDLIKLPNLTSLDALSGLMYLPISVTIDDNENLTNIDTLLQLEELLPIERFLSLYNGILNNPKLPDCDAKALMDTINDLGNSNTCYGPNLSDECTVKEDCLFDIDTEDDY